MKLRYITILGCGLGVFSIVFFFYLHFNPSRQFYKTSYKSLREETTLFEKKLEKERSLVERKEISRESFPRIVTLENKVKKLKQEIFNRHLNFITAVFSIILLSFVSFIAVVRLARFGRISGITGIYHRGKIETLPTQVEYVFLNELDRRMSKGFLDQNEAENFLRTDDFLSCRYCGQLVKEEVIGTVQEIVFMEEPPAGASKDYRNKLGSIWITKPKDKFRCQKCGHDLIRTP